MNTETAEVVVMLLLFIFEQLNSYQGHLKYKAFFIVFHICSSINGKMFLDGGCSYSIYQQRLTSPFSMFGRLTLTYEAGALLWSSYQGKYLTSFILHKRDTLNYYSVCINVILTLQLCSTHTESFC